MTSLPPFHTCRCCSLNPTQTTSRLVFPSRRDSVQRQGSPSVYLRSLLIHPAPFSLPTSWTHCWPLDSSSMTRLATFFCRAVSAGLFGILHKCFPPPHGEASVSASDGLRESVPYSAQSALRAFHYDGFQFPSRQSTAPHIPLLPLWQRTPILP